jgi:hypothetical protein
VAAVFAVYGQTLGFGFVNLDDSLYVSGPSRAGPGLGVEGVVWAFTPRHDGNWLPLTRLSHMLDVALFGLEPGGHHAVNVFLHAGNALLLLGVLLALTGALWPSAFAAAAFALHPLHVESVAWVAERKDVLSTAFALLCLACYARYARAGGKGWLLGCAGCLLLGLLAKPMLVTLPFLLLLLDVWPLGRWGGAAALPVRRLLWEKLPLFALSAAASLVTLAAQGGRGALEPGAGVALPQRLASAVVAYVRYLRQTVWPSDLVAFYPHPYLPEQGGVPPASAEIVGSVVLLVAVSALVWRLRRYGYLLVGWAWYLGTLVPVIGLVQVGGQGMADRYTYLPLVGIFVMLAWGARDLLARAGSRALRRAVAVLAFGILAALAVGAHAQARLWSDSETLYSHALRVDPGNRFMRFALALWLRQQDRAAQAIAHYRVILREDPESARALNGLGMAHASLGEHAAAVPLFEAAAQRTPSASFVHFNLAGALRGLGRHDEALAAYRQALALRPASPRIRLALAVALAAHGDREEALVHYRWVLERDPTNGVARRGLERALSAGAQVPAGAR